MRDPRDEWCERQLELLAEDIRAEQKEIAAANRCAVLLMIVSGVLVICGLFFIASGANGADPVPTFQVENKVPPSFVVVNRITAEKPQTVPGVAPRPGEPARTPGVVPLPRPFSESTMDTGVLVRSGGTADTSGVVLSLPTFTSSSPIPIHTGRVLSVDRYGRTRTLPAPSQCAGFV